MKNLSSVIFDVDGVLLDSLPAHLQICEDKNREYELGLSIPGAAHFRKMVRRGVKISPMNFFFQAVGFPSEDADRAFEQYKQTFRRDYRPGPFPQINEMLFKLVSAGLKLGIVTSNYRSNVDAGLGPNMRFFNPECIITKDDYVSDSKSDALLSAAKRLNADIMGTIYVGDQPADWIAAKEAGVNFLGVTYGWGISEKDNEFPVVNSVMAVADYILVTGKAAISSGEVSRLPSAKTDCP
jgi:phosphoglycolate phosphatase-like HAD superfamily hydrolase